MKSIGTVLCILAAMCLVGAQSPPLSVSFASPDLLQFSWPSNFTSWQLISTTNLPSGIWQPVPLAPFATNTALSVFMPVTDARRYFRLQETGAGSCVFQATPSAINSGQSSTLSWCPLAGYTYRLSPAPGGGSGIVPGGSVVVSPTNTTVYSLIASNAQGVLSNNTTVIVNPCGWLGLTNIYAVLFINYNFSISTVSYNFNISHTAAVTFYFFGLATGVQLPGFASAADSGQIQDREDDKATAPPHVFTTTETGGPGSLRHDVSSMSLHLTCTTYDFSYNILINNTEVTEFGTTTSIDGVGTGAIIPRPFSLTNNRIVDSDYITATYPPVGGGDYFVPSSDVGEDLFTTGTATSPNAGRALVNWIFLPAP